MSTKLLFLCTGNACRSQMAEGWSRALGGEAVAVRSAGIESHGLNPRAVQVMAEAGVAIDRQSSDVVSDEDIAWADCVVTVCGNADEHCPVIPPGTSRVHWPVPDPARATGSEEEILTVFRRTRDDIRERVAELIGSFEREGA